MKEIALSDPDYSVYSIRTVDQDRKTTHIYVGISNSLSNRWRQHKTSIAKAREGFKIVDSKRLYSALASTAPDSVIFEVSATGLTRAEASETERDLVMALKSQYGRNCLNTARGGLGPEPVGRGTCRRPITVEDLATTLALLPPVGGLA